ncbi:MAG TPA: cation:proton antiporter [Thermoplasmata archaeon]
MPPKSLHSVAAALLLLSAATSLVTGGAGLPAGAQPPAPASVLHKLADGNITTPLSGSVDVLTAFLAVGGIIAIGFLAGLIFDRTRVPDLLILIFLGVLLGPISLTFFGFSLVPAAILQFVTPYFTAVALMIILFDGGLNLRLSEIAKYLGLAGFHTGVTFIATVFVISFVTAVVLGYPWPVGLLVGAILGGTSSAVVIGVVRPLRASEETKVILTLESVLTDVLCVVTVLALIELLRGGPGASVLPVFASLGRSFLVAIAVGAAIGLGWLLLLRKLEGKPFSYMLTIAILFVVYATAELAGGSGAMAAFTFGIILGNHRSIERRLTLKSRHVVDERIRQFHGEIAFVVRTFFFVFLGIVFSFQFTGSWGVATQIPVLDGLNGTFWLFFLGILFVFAGIIAVRVLVARATAHVHHKPAAERRLLWSVMGRGLAAAVLASLPFTIPPFLSPSTSGDLYYVSILAPYEAQFLNAAFFVIILTVVVTTIGVVSSERALGRTAEVAPPTVYGAGVLELFKDLDLDDLEIREKPPSTAARRPETKDRKRG